MNPQPSNHSLFSPLAQPRLWVILLWALTFAVAAAGFDRFQRHLRDEAAGQKILLVSDQSPGDNQRAELLKKMESEPGVASAAWISPADQVRRIQGQFPDESWREAFPANEAWLPWMLEVGPADPLRNRDLLTGFIARRRQEGGWQVYWDGSTLDSLIARSNSAAITTLVFALLIFAIGGLALTQMPRSLRPVAEVAESTLITLIVIVALWAAAALAGAWADGRALAVAAATGFILACFVAPMLRLRRIPGLPAKSTFSTTVTEAPDERIR